MSELENVSIGTPRFRGLTVTLAALSLCGLLVIVAYWILR